MVVKKSLMDEVTKIEKTLSELKECKNNENNQKEINDLSYKVEQLKEAIEDIENKKVTNNADPTTNYEKLEVKTYDYSRDSNYYKMFGWIIDNEYHYSNSHHIKITFKRDSNSPYYGIWEKNFYYYRFVDFSGALLCEAFSKLKKLEINLKNTNICGGFFKKINLKKIINIKVKDFLNEINQYTDDLLDKNKKSLRDKVEEELLHDNTKLTSYADDIEEFIRKYKINVKDDKIVCDIAGVGFDTISNNLIAITKNDSYPKSTILFYIKN